MTVKSILLGAEVGLKASKDPFQPKLFYNSNSYISVILYF